MEYRYTVADQPFTGRHYGRPGEDGVHRDDLHRLRTAVKSGSAVPIRYDPSHPERSFIEADGDGMQFFVAVWWVLTVIGAGGTLWGLWLAVRVLRHR